MGGGCETNSSLPFSIVILEPTYIHHGVRHSSSCELAVAWTTMGKADWLEQKDEQGNVYCK